MKKNSFIILFIIISLYFIFISIFKFDSISFQGTEVESNIVNIKYFTNSNCGECTQLDDYLKVYKKAGVKFGNISIIEYLGGNYKDNIDKYNITKLPFIVFSKELSKYETIANSWDATFGYKNNNGEFIPTDIIPPYFDLNTKKIYGLIDIIYIGDNSCEECFNLEKSMSVLEYFGLKFNKIDKIDIKSQKAISLIKNYDINIFPTIILSKNLDLYKNFSYFWQSIGTVEKDGKYILRNPGNLGLKVNSK